MRAETIIATHANTDFDALASMLAVRHLYPGSVACLAGSLNRNVRELCRLYTDELELVEASRLELDAVRRLIVVEAAGASRLAELEPLALDPNVEKVVFDHHAGEMPDFALPDNVVISEDGALTTALVGILAEREVAVTPLEATIFALGIHEDTGSLTYPSTTQRDADALSWCLRHGARQELLERYLHTPLASDERELLDALIDALETHELPGLAVLVASLGWPSYVEGVSNLAHKIVDLTDCRGLVLLVEMDRRVFCVVRSRSHVFDAAAAAAALGGGGHEQAASAIFRGPLAEARKELLAALPAALQEPVRARDVMSQPARTVSPSETVAEAMTLCQRYGQSGVLVLDDGRLVGSVGREDLDRAIGHGLSHAPVKGIMSGRVPTASGEATLVELQQLLTDSDEGRIAIVDGEGVTGVVTRRDVLRALDEPAEQSAHETGESIASELRDLERLAPVFAAISAASEGVEGVYLVGGTVRDILLGEQSFDVDIAVEGDAIALARRIARELGGRTREHEKFGTAVVVVRRRPARRRRHGTYGVLRRACRAARRRARVDPRGSLPPRLHRQRHGRVAQGRGLRAPRRPVRWAKRPRRRDRARPPQPLLHRGSDAHLQGHPLREPLRLSHGRAHGAARALLRGDGPGGRPVLGAIARRGDGAAGGR